MEDYLLFKKTQETTKQPEQKEYILRRYSPVIIVKGPYKGYTGMINNIKEDDAWVKIDQTTNIIPKKLSLDVLRYHDGYFKNLSLC